LAELPILGDLAEHVAHGDVDQVGQLTQDGSLSPLSAAGHSEQQDRPILMIEFGHHSPSLWRGESEFRSTGRVEPQMTGVLAWKRPAYDGMQRPPALRRLRRSNDRGGTVRPLPDYDAISRPWEQDEARDPSPAPSPCRDRGTGAVPRRRVGYRP